MATETKTGKSRARSKPAKKAGPGGKRAGAQRSNTAAPKGRKARAAARNRARQAKLRAKSGNRWRIHYDVDGPRVRLGMLWFLGAIVALALGTVGIVVYFGVAFAAASAHVLRTWRARGHAVDPRVALLSTVVVVAAAGLGPQAMGVGVLALTAAAIAVSARRSEGPKPTPVLAETGLILQATLATAVAGGCLVLLADLEVWAAIALVLLVSAYETGDYLIGSGSANVVEGPLAGFAAVVVVSFVVAAAGVPPFGLGQALAFGVAVAPLAFLGQLLGSAMLPHSRSFAPALRRVDSLLLAAPLWYLGVDLFVV